eukprot:7212560-Lingulodinium_polyedra.AAC.1
MHDAVAAAAAPGALTRNFVACHGAPLAGPHAARHDAEQQASAPMLPLLPKGGEHPGRDSD